MMTLTDMVGMDLNDAELVALSLAGNRDAFERIVSRYQSLICSLAYSATGCLGHSEDLAQETFIAAWTNLARLQEPGKLRSWLCGIARNCINNFLRRECRLPVAETDDAMPEPIAMVPSPPDQAIGREEAALLWRALERMPEIYRQPLVLYYRENCSVAATAGLLDLSEDAVKQRLARGRKLLAEGMAAFVEGALKQTAPGRAFTLAVLGSAPMMALPAKAAVLGTAAGGGAAVKSAGLAGFLSAIFGPLAMFIGLGFAYKLDKADAVTSVQKAFAAKCYRILFAAMALFVLAILALVFWGWPLHQSHPSLFIGLAAGLMSSYLLFVILYAAWVMRTVRGLHRTDCRDSQAFEIQPVFEYRSRLAFLGWPLVHIRMRGGLNRGPVKAWFAAGDAAIGLVFAAGGMALAPVAIGGLAAGFLTLGGIGLGVLVFGGFSFGIWALGGMAVGVHALGGCAIAWSAAQGGVAIAREMAAGAAAFALHANDALSKEWFARSAFFQNAMVFLEHAHWINLLWLLAPALWWMRRQSKKS